MIKQTYTNLFLLMLGVMVIAIGFFLAMMFITLYNPWLGLISLFILGPGIVVFCQWFDDRFLR